jgi:hypothetical protein
MIEEGFDSLLKGEAGNIRLDGSGILSFIIQHLFTASF